MHTAIVCQRTRLRGSTAPLRQDFAHCIEPDTEERQAKSLGERGSGAHKGTGVRFSHTKIFAPNFEYPRARAQKGAERRKECIRSI